MVAENSFVIEAVQSIPADARSHEETSVSWLDTECGGLAELCGATKLYKSGVRIIIAVVTSKAYLIPFGDVNQIPISKGIWRICPPD
jgi:hypothetical protein